MLCCLGYDHESENGTTWLQLLNVRGAKLWEIRQLALNEPVVILPLNSERKKFIRVFCTANDFLQEEKGSGMDKFATAQLREIRSLTQTVGKTWKEHRAMMKLALNGIKEMSFKAAINAKIELTAGFKMSKVDLKAMVQKFTLQWAVVLFYGKYDEEFSACFFDYFKQSRALHKNHSALSETKDKLAEILNPVNEDGLISNIFKCGLTKESSKSNCISAMTAAYDATYALVFFTIWNLAKNEMNWKKAQSVVDSENKIETEKDLETLSYLKSKSTEGLLVDASSLSFLGRALTETLRVYPPVWTLPRNCPMGKEISSKLDVLSANKATNREWNPDSCESKLQITSFGVGKRSCPAGTAALIAAYTLLRRFISLYERPSECIVDNSLHSIYLGPTLCMEGAQFFFLQQRKMKKHD